MSDNLLQKLKNWRTKVAQRENVTPFRVFPNKVLEAIISIRPKTKDEMLAIKGIRERKFDKYGQDLLAIINDSDLLVVEASKSINPLTHSVSQYLKLLNSGLKKYPARLLAEVSSFKEVGKGIYYNLSDKNDNSVLSCFMWKNDYDLCGVILEIGLEVIVEGFPRIYEPKGILNFQTQSIELVGEGALKAAYDKLKNKLAGEGLFEEARKKKIPNYPQKIGVITSKQGAVIEDFLNNLGKHGYQISLIDSRVEGQRAIKDLLSALSRFGRENLDVLVIIRGGGSMESMMAFDNEVLVRKIADYPIPVIAGIGHHKDVPLMALAADIMVSTPTAATKILNKSWEEASSNCEGYKNRIFNSYLTILSHRKSLLDKIANIINDGFGRIFSRFNHYQFNIKTSLIKIEARLAATADKLANYFESISEKFNSIISNINNQIDNAARSVRYNDPRRQIALGYSIVRGGGRIIRSIEDGRIGEEINIQTLGGTIDSTIIKINKA